MKAPRFVVVCAFRKLEIWEPGAFPKEPRLVLDLVDLPDQYDALLFLAGDEPVFAGGQAELTREAVTKLYNQVDDGAWRDLADLHAELDEAVAAAYGWPRSVAHDSDETNRRLLELNRAIVAGEIAYEPFGRA